MNNESAEITRMFNKEFNAIAEHPEVDLYPAELQKEIDNVNEWVYDTINNGVYKAGFATKQQPYDEVGPVIGELCLQTLCVRVDSLGCIWC